MYKHRIHLRVILIIINTIDNTRKIIGSRTHQSIQSLSIERILDLIRINTADSGDPVCVNKAALQIIAGAVCFQFV